MSKITQAAASKAHEHLHDAEGFVQKKMNEGQASLEKKAGVSDKPTTINVLEYFSSMVGRPRAPRKRRAYAGYMVG